MREMLPLQEELEVSLHMSNNSLPTEAEPARPLTCATMIQQPAGKPESAAEHHAHIAFFDNKQPKIYLMRAKPSSQG